jgi:hypothetical protein
MADEEIRLKISIDGAERELGNIQSLRDAVSELEENLENAEFGSEAFKRSAAELKKARGELFEFDKQLEGLQDPVKGAEQWVKFGEGIAGAFAAAQGAALLFGVESENVEKLVAKAQGATAIAVGARALAESRLFTILKNTTAGKYAAIVAEKAYALAVGTSTGLLKLFRIALVSTGIGAVAVGVGLLVANWDKWSESIKNTIDRLTQLIPGLETIKKGFEAVRNFIMKTAESLNLVASAEEKAAEQAAEESAKWYAGEAKRAKERDEKQKEAADKWAAGAAARQAQREREFTEAMELSQELDDLFNELVDNFNLRADSVVPIQIVDVDQIGAQLTGIDLFIEKKKELDELDRMIVANGNERNKESAELLAEITKETEELQQRRIDSFLQGSAVASSAINTLSSLADSFSKNGKKNEKIQKTLAVTSIAIDTAVGIAGAVKAGAGIPFPGNLAAIVSGIASVLAGIAAAKNALSKAGGDTGGIVTTASIPSATPPQFQTPEEQERQASSQGSESAFGMPVFKTYVLETDVSSSLEARQRVEDIATFRG